MSRDAPGVKGWGRSRPVPSFAACFRALFHGAFALFFVSSPHPQGEVNKGDRCSAGVKVPFTPPS